MKNYSYLLLAALFPALYLMRLDADTIGGLFGIFWDDEGAYLLSAKNQVLFGAAHFFDGDRWLPELLSPLLHQLALWVMSPADPVFSIRLAVALHVLLGATLIAWVAHKYTGSLPQAAACFAIVLLNPVLFFYARIGLAEGLQFLLLALILATLFLLHQAKQSQVLWLCALGGALTGGLLVSKLSAAPACIGLSLGAVLSLWQNRMVRRKILPAAGFALGAMAVIGLYATAGIGDRWPDWWRMHTSELARRAPFDLRIALSVFQVKLSDIAYYFTLMPIVALYFCCLFVGAGKPKGFLNMLSLVALVIVFLESFFGGEIRRNFFSIAMMSVVAGFTYLDYLQAGVPRLRPLTFAKTFAALLIALHLMGVAYLFYLAVNYYDSIYMILCAVFLLLFLLLAAASGARYLPARKLLSGVVILCSLLPMAYQAFLTPRTREEASRVLEEAVAEDGVITGAAAPWVLLGVKRRIVMTNCTWQDARINFGNDIEAVPIPYDYFISITPDRNLDHCTPPDFVRFRQKEHVVMFSPSNLGGRGDSSAFWKYQIHRILYEK